MALMLTRDGMMSRLGGYRAGARGLLRGTDSALRRELRSVRSSEIALSSFSFGVLQGRFKDKGGLTFFALPVDLLAGATMHILGLFPFAKPYAHHLHAFGDGALASFFTTTGYRVGERWARGGGLRAGLSGIFGDDKPIAGGASIADKELASLVKGG
jgi:hypothetical protein